MSAKTCLRIIVIAIFLGVTIPELPALVSSQKEMSGQSNRRKRRQPAKSPAKSGTAKSPAKNSGNKSGATKSKNTAETSAEIKKRQEATQKEIRLTEEQIKENEKSVRIGLTELGKIEGDISESKNKISVLNSQITDLTTRINTLESSISSDEAELTKLRDEYLKAVKKMRITRKNMSEMAFLFSASNFNQAVRRLRYLREFSEWKDRQSKAIAGKIESLKKEKENLASTLEQKNVVLKRRKDEQTVLEKNYSQQNLIVADLRKNGEALKSHLQKKQAEANDLKARISAVIAEEQRKAAEENARKEAEQQARMLAEAEARRAEEARLEEERIAKAEQEHKEAEEARLKAIEEARLAEEEKKAAASQKKKEEAEKKKLEAERKKAEAEKKKAEAQKKKEEAKKQKEEAEKKRAQEKEQAPTSYADARRRKPRGDNASTSESVPSAGASASSSAATFADMKGRLPHPVSGSFKVTSRFGLQSLPDLPDVTYDNPGIDAETAAGASAVSVFGGKVSGVYMLPGYNTVIIVNHGNYYTVYGNISSAAVKVGDNVKTGQTLGRLAPNEDDETHGMIHFEVWKNRDKLNPLDWISH